ncbi:MAG: RluA family pseudouridine synthase [Acidobacteria bacterium]|nr:RluA family pseudouridine synthase [Acidobacteriota bacterium]
MPSTESAVSDKLQLEFTAGEEGLRLDTFVCRELPRVSQTRVRRLIAERDIEVNGQQSQKGYKLKNGDRVTVRMYSADKSAATPEQMDLSILYEDRELIVVDKPPGLLVHPSHREKSGTLTNGLAWHFWMSEGEAIRPGLVHRLDRQTSGAIVVAKTARAHRTLSKHFRERWVRKTYLALVSGVVAVNEGVIDAPIGSDPNTWPKWQVMETGRAAVTRYYVRQRFAGHTLLELEPLTGRTHQLRIHCSLIGHPIVGDSIYSPVADSLTRRYRLRFQLLHAWRLSFKHPATSLEIRCEAPIPSVLSQIVEDLAGGRLDGNS